MVKLWTMKETRRCESVYVARQAGGRLQEKEAAVEIGVMVG